MDKIREGRVAEGRVVGQFVECCSGGNARMAGRKKEDGRTRGVNMKKFENQRTRQH